MAFYRVIEIDGFEDRNYAISTAKRPDHPLGFRAYTKADATETAKLLNCGFEAGMQYVMDNIGDVITNAKFPELDED